MIKNSDSSAVQNIELLADWRSKLLNGILNGAIIAGAFAIVPGILGSASPLFTIIYLAAYLLLLVARFVKLSHTLKSAIFLVLTFGLGLAGLLDTAIWGDSRTFMIAFIVFTSLLLSPRISWYALAITLLTYLVTGWLILSKHYLLPTQEVNPGTLTSWLSGATTVAVVSVAIMQGLRLLQDEFLSAQQRSDQILEKLDLERENLEENVRVRTHELETKTFLLGSAAELAHEFSRYVNQKDLLDNAVDLISHNFDHYHAGIYLLDERAEFAYLYSASSEVGKQMQRSGFRIELLNIGLSPSSAEHRPIIKKNIGSENQARDAMHLAESRSQILLAISIRGSVFGVLDVQSKFPDVFSEPAHTQALKITADQLSLAIENAILTSEARVINEQIETLSARQSLELWKDRGEQHPSYQYTPLGVQALTEPLSANGTDPHSLTLPVNLRNQKLGTLRIKRKSTDAPWDQQDRDILREITHQMSLALENARLLEDAQRRVAQEQQIGELTARIGASFDVDTILRVTAQEIGRALGDAEVSVTLNPDQVRPANSNGTRK